MKLNSNPDHLLKFISTKFQSIISRKYVPFLVFLTMILFLKGISMD